MSPTLWFDRSGQLVASHAEKRCQRGIMYATFRVDHPHVRIVWVLPTDRNILRLFPA